MFGLGEPDVFIGGYPVKAGGSYPNFLSLRLNIDTPFHKEWTVLNFIGLKE